jgi:hypothetical protein
MPWDDRRHRNRARKVFRVKQLHEALVEDLPWPFKPFRCLHYPRVRWLLEAEEPDTASAATLSSAMLRRLTPEEVNACPYHSADWRLAAELSVSLHRDGLRPGTNAFEKAALAGGAEEDELWAIRSFWTEPISWQRGQASVTNGQHRICALKLSGATVALIEAD